MRTLLILNDPPYGTERSYNALRLARTLSQREGREVRVFLLGDAVACAKAGQSVPNGYYNLERMAKWIANRGAEIAACCTCIEARGIAEDELVAGVSRGTLEQLADWTEWAERILLF